MYLHKKIKNYIHACHDVIFRPSITAALALRDVPEVNAKWDAKTGAAVLSAGVDISVAVATPNGLITPIVTGLVSFISIS